MQSSFMTLLFVGLVVLHAPRAEAQQLALEAGRDQAGLDASVGLFVAGAVLGTVGTGAAWGFLIPAISCSAGGGSSDCQYFGWLSATGFIAWGVGVILIITASIVHGVSRGRTIVSVGAGAELRPWSFTNDLGTSGGGLELAFQ